MKKGMKKHGRHVSKKKREFVTISPTMVEVTGFNVFPDSQILGVPELVNSNDYICIVDIRNIDVVDRCILDNVGGRRLVWRRSTLQCKSCCFICRVLHRHLQ